MRTARAAAVVFTALVSSLGTTAHAVEVVQVRDPGPSFVRVSPEVVIPGEDAGYLLVLPDRAPRGLLATFASGRDTSSAGYEMRLYEPAIEAGLAFAFITTGNRLDFFFGDSTMAIADGYIGDILDGHGIPGDRLVLAGMSLSGTRALRYVGYCKSGKARSGADPRAVAICDAPLDFVRFWYECDESERVGFHEIAAAEGAWVTGHLEMNLGGPPGERLEAYRAYSPYSHLVAEGGNARHLAGVALRAYTEPDVEWWLSTRRKDYYGMNAIDLAALVKTQLNLGNEEAELIVTHGKGHHPDGTRHPHSWSIVDNEELVRWFVETLDADE